MIRFTTPVEGTMRLYSVSNGVKGFFSYLYGDTNTGTISGYMFVSGSSWCVTLEVNGVESPFSETITF